MKKLILIFTIVIVYKVSIAQDYQKEINEQVWLPFLKASSEFDGEAFMALQSKDLIRAAIDTKDIHGYDVYAEGILPNFKRIKEEGKVKRITEIRFTERIASSNEAYETGYFKSTTTRANGDIRVRYSHFYIVLKKENNAWKILVDADTNFGGSITEEMFQAAKPF